MYARQDVLSYAKQLVDQGRRGEAFSFYVESGAWENALETLPSEGDPSRRASEDVLLSAMGKGSAYDTHLFSTQDVSIREGTGRREKWAMTLETVARLERWDALRELVSSAAPHYSEAAAQAAYFAESHCRGACADTLYSDEMGRYFQNPPRGEDPRGQERRRFEGNMRAATLLEGGHQIATGLGSSGTARARSLRARCVAHLEAAANAFPTVLGGEYPLIEFSDLFEFANLASGVGKHDLVLSAYANEGKVRADYRKERWEALVAGAEGATGRFADAARRFEDLGKETDKHEFIGEAARLYSLIGDDERSYILLRTARMSAEKTGDFAACERYSRELRDSRRSSAYRHLARMSTKE